VKISCVFAEAMGVVSGISAAVTFFLLLAAVVYWLVTSKTASKWIEEQEDTLIEKAIDGTQVVRAEINSDVVERMQEVEQLASRQQDRLVKNISGVLVQVNEAATKQLTDAFDRGENFSNKQRDEWFAEARKFVTAETANADALIERNIKRLSDLQEMQMTRTVEVPGKATWYTFLEGLIQDGKNAAVAAGNELTDSGMVKLTDWVRQRKAHANAKFGFGTASADITME
jgi:hypothetical protein